MIHDKGCLRRAGEDRCWCALRSVWSEEQAPALAIVGIVCVGVAAVLIATLLWSGCGGGQRRCQAADVISFKGDRTSPCREEVR